jgi:hypothetical protein
VTDVRADIYHDVSGLKKASKDSARQRFVVQEIEVPQIDGLELFWDVETVRATAHGETLLRKQVTSDGPHEPVLVNGEQIAPE